MASMIVALILGAAHAQMLPQPKLTHISPLAGQPGSSFELSVSGSDLDNVEGLHFSFPGATVEVLETTKPESPMETKKKGGKKKAPDAQTKQKFRVTLPPQTPFGIHDVRVVTKAGVSNPRAFLVSEAKEILEQEPNDNVDKAQKVEIGSAISGIIATPTDVDYFRFHGKKGERVLLSCLTTSIDSKLPAHVELYTPQGKFLGSNKGYHNNDALLDVTLPEDSDYLVRLSSFTYTQGGADFFYHLAITTAPWIDAVVPPVVQAGAESVVTIYGRNLPGGKADQSAVVDGKVLEKRPATVRPSGDLRQAQRLAFSGFIPPYTSGLDGVELRLGSGGGLSNPYLLGLTHGPVSVGNEKNGTPDTAQAVQVPGTICGRLQTKGEKDYYSFTAKKGQILNFDLVSDRLGAPTDLNYEIFTLKDGKRAAVTAQEDTPDNFGIQFPNPTSDPPAFRFTVPADGTYYVAVGSLESATQFGPRHYYALQVTGDEPDFRLIAMPVSNQAAEAVVLGQSGRQAYSVFVWRLRGFTGDVTLRAEDLPPGVTMQPQLIAGNQKQAAFVLSADKSAAPAISAIKIVGTATINGKEVVREVRGATITWTVPPQQNIPVIARLDRELLLAIRDKAPFHVSVEKDKLAVLQGQKLILPVKVEPGEYKGSVTLTAASLPTGMVLQQPVTVDPAKGVAQVTFDSKPNVQPGKYTLVLRGQTQDPKGKPNPKGGPQVNMIQAAPPIAITIVPKQIAKLTAPKEIKLKVGEEAEITLAVERQYDYPGNFKIELAPPKDFKGLSAEPVTLTPDAREIKLMVRAGEDAPAGQAPVLTIRATALVDDTVAVVHEAKVTVTLVK